MLERLGVLTDEVSADIIEALDWVEENGLKHVEIRMVNGRNVADLTDVELDQLLAEVEKRGLFISGVASPLFKCALDPTREVASGDRFGQDEISVEAHFTKLWRMLQIAKRLKTDKIRIFSFWREKEPEKYEQEVVDHLKKAAEMAAEHDCLLLLENESTCNGGYAVEVSRIVRQVDSPHLKVLWDPGNEVHGGRSAYPEGYQHVRGLIDHVHIKDASIEADGTPTCVPVGEGKVPYLEQLQALHDDGYDGLYTIETHYVPEGGTAMDGTALTLKGIKEVAKKLKS